MLSLIAALLVTTSSFAAESPKITKEKFGTDYKAKMAELFCGEKAYFRQCFTSAADICKKNAITAAEGCLKEMDKTLPTHITNQEEGKTWGVKLGTCAGEKFELALLKEKKDTADCKDPAKWK
jgi:hypothetical protein